VNFFDAFPILMDLEGHSILTDHPKDKGGLTKWGISQAVARENGFEGDMADLTMGTAMKIAEEKYWNAVKADELPPELRYCVFDAAFNSGVVPAVRWLQRSVLVKDDGIIGPKTIEAANKQDPYKTKAYMCAKRLVFIASLGNFDAFGKGWTRRIARVLEV